MEIQVTVNVQEKDGNEFSQFEAEQLIEKALMKHCECETYNIETGGKNVVYVNSFTVTRPLHS